MQSIFKSTTVLWEDVSDIATYTLNRNEFIGFVIKDKLERKKMGGLGASFNASMGGIYGASIPLKQIGKLNRDKVILTLKKKHENIKEKQIAEVNEKEVINNESQIGKIIEMTNFKKAVIISLMVASAVGVVYLLSILLLQVNILVLPIAGVIAIFYYFEKYVDKKDYNMLCRIWMAFLSAYSVYLVRISMIFIFGKILPTPSNILTVLNEYFFIYLPKNLGQEFVWLLTSVITLILGFIQGPSFKLFQKVKSLFMKKSGRIPYEKDEGYYTLYFMAPDEYDENADKYRFDIKSGCEIQTDRKKPIYFKIPFEIINEAGLKWPHEYIKKSMDGKYLEIDLGGVGNTAEYVYDTFIICDIDKKIELIKIEVH